MLQRGQNYQEVGQVVHIGFLNFSPKWNPPEFYAVYKLQNIKNHTVYSDKFTLGMVDLTQIGLATDEDQDWQLDDWAKLFTADTWEEIQMIAKNSEYLAEASQMLYELNTDDIERQKCRAREDYYRLQDMMQKEKEKAVREKEKAVREKEELTGENEKLVSVNEMLATENKELREEFSAKERALIEELERMRQKLEQNGISV